VQKFLKKYACSNHRRERGEREREIKHPDLFDLRAFIYLLFIVLKCYSRFWLILQDVLLGKLAIK
jgi:hypothetical protein